MPDHAVNTSDERLGIALSWLRSNAAGLSRLGRDEQVMAALGLLICDDAGHVSEAALRSALDDSEALSAANLLLSAVGI